MSSETARQSRVPDLLGCPTVRWIADTRRVSHEHAAHLHNVIVAMVDRHGIDAALHRDVVDLSDLYYAGKIWYRRRHLVRRAQRTLRVYHGLSDEAVV